MHAEGLWAAIRRRPFVPFRLHVSDGSSYDLRHPEALGLTRHGAYLFLPGDSDQIPQRALIISLIHISRLEELTGTPAGDKGTGS